MYMVELSCPNCQKTYLADPKRLKHGRQTTCSRQCSYELRGKRGRVSVDLVCQVCGNSFERKPFQIRAKNVTVCSDACYKQARRMGLVTPKPPTLPPSEFDCQQCGKHVVIPAALIGARRFRFCSPECANEWHSGEQHNNWKGGYNGYYGKTWKRQRNLARKRDGYTCQDCGITEMALGRQLDVHHIVRFSDFPDSSDANRLGNLTTLCHSCHIKREWLDYPETRVR
jgi:5-methylcytosine-specific restriction endonuclease McrA